MVAAVGIGSGGLSIKGVSDDPMLVLESVRTRLVKVSDEFFLHQLAAGTRRKNTQETSWCVYAQSIESNDRFTCP